MPSPFGQSPDAFWAQYQIWQNEVDKWFNESRKAAGLDAHVARSMLDLSTSNSEMLNALPFTKRKEMIDWFRTRVLKFNELDIESSWRPIGPGGGGVTVGRFAPTVDPGGPLSFVLRQMSIQRDPTGKGVEQFRFGGNIPRVDYAKNMAKQLSAGITITPGQSILVFDTETVGLQSEAAGVRQVAALRLTTQGHTLGIDPNSLFDQHFNVARTGYGAIQDPDSGRIIRMDDFVRRLSPADINNAPSDGSDFIRRLMPLFKQMDEADYIAAHNAEFDINQIILNAVKTGEYNTDPTVRGLVNRIGQKIKSGKVLDTLVMARDYKAYGGDLSLAPELKGLGKPSLYSLENLMLQTNLSSLLRRDMGKDFIEMFKRGQHTADVDTTITAKLLNYLTKEELKAGTLDDIDIRRTVLRSYAPTPVSNIVDVRHISPDMFKRLYNEGGDSLRVFRIGTSNPLDLATKTADEWYAELTSDTSPYFANPKLTPMEQQITATRRLGVQAEASGEALSSTLGSWRRYAGINTPYEGALNRLHTLFKKGRLPSDMSFSKFQETMASRRIPFAGISLPERILTGSIAEAGGRPGLVQTFLKGSREVAAAKYGDDLGIGRWSQRTRFAMTKSGVAAMPLNVLQAAEKEGVIGSAFLDSRRAQMLSLSTVPSTQSVNLMYDIGRDETKGLLRWMEEAMQRTDGNGTTDLLRRSGMTRAMLGEMQAKLLGEETYKHGINVGHLSGNAGRQVFTTMNDLLQNLTRDRDKIPFRVGFMSSDTDKLGRGVIRTGAAILDRFLDPSEAEVYNTDLRRASKRLVELQTTLGDAHQLYRARMAYTHGIEGVSQAADKIYETIRKRAPVVGGAAAVVFGGFMAYKKRKERALYDETMHQQGYESEQDYQTYREEMGLSPAPAVRRLDPLLYAGTVGNLHRNAIGHTQMNAYDKNRGLFSGV